MKKKIHKASPRTTKLKWKKNLIRKFILFSVFIMKQTNKQTKNERKQQKKNRTNKRNETEIHHPHHLDVLTFYKYV